MTLARFALPTALRGARMRALAGAVIAVTLVGCAGPADTGAPPPDGLRIAAAASLEAVAPSLLAAFTAQHPAATLSPPTFDGSAILAEQIRAGAPYDVLLAADDRTTTDLASAGVLADDPVPFARNLIEIVVTAGNPLGIRSLADLASSAGTAPLVVVLCAPEVPCGRAAATIFDEEGIALGTDLVPASEEQNVTAVLRRVSQGEADAGIVYRSDIARAAGAVTGVPVRGADVAATTLTAAVIATGDRERERAARDFVQFLRSDAARTALLDAGFSEHTGGSR